MNLLSLVPFGKWGDEKGVDVPLEGHWPKAYFCRSFVNVIIGLLAPQSGTLGISAYRDFHPIPIPNPNPYHF